MRLGYFFFAVFMFISTAAFGQSEIVFAGICESNGNGTIAGISFKNGYNLAIDELNANGGLAGKRIVVKQFNINTSAEAAKQATMAAVAEKPFAVLGPVFSGLTLETMPITSAAGIPQFTGAEAASITRTYPTHLFRTSLTQEISIPRMASFVKYAFQAKRVAIVWVDNPFGKDGKDIFVKAINRLGATQIDDVAVKPGQKDFSGVVVQLKRTPPDVLVIYTNEAEAVDLLKELRRREFDRPIVGEGPLTSQQVLDSADGAAEGVYAHTGVSVDVPNPRISAFVQKYKDKYQSRPDHNAVKGYFAVYAIKAVFDASGPLDREAFISAMKKARFDLAQQPNMLVRGAYDLFGNLHRESYLVRIHNGRQFVVATIPPFEGQTIDLASGKEIYLNSNEGRKQFLAQANSAH